MAKNKSKGWAAFPHASKAFDYAGAKLEKAWSELHRGDREPFPSVAHLKALFKTNAGLAKATPGFKDDYEALASALQEGWRAYHRGDFQSAFESADSLGPVGATLANKAQGIHAVYLVEDDDDKLERFQAIASRAEAAAKVLPKDANAHYFRAFALGRYSQGISVGKALAQGLGGKIKDSLDQALKCDDLHAEAHTALGLYHAEIIDKVGAMIGGLTYGAKAATGQAHFDRALKLTPKAPIAWIEYANGLMMMYGNKRIDDATEAYVKASELEPIDAMQALDVAYAKDQLE